MLYACNTCKQTFWGFDRFMPQQCPECGHLTVRKASEEEQTAYELEQARSWQAAHIRKEA